LVLSTSGGTGGEKRSVAAMATGFAISGDNISSISDEDNAQLSVLADAIKKMDGMIGDFR